MSLIAAAAGVAGAVFGKSDANKGVKKQIKYAREAADKNEALAREGAAESTAVTTKAAGDKLRTLTGASKDSQYALANAGKDALSDRLGASAAIRDRTVANEFRTGDIAGRAIRDASGNLISGERSARDEEIAALRSARDTMVDTGRSNIRDARSTYDRLVGSFDPYTKAGQGATDALSYELGLSDRPSDYAGFRKTPGYEFAMKEGLDSVTAANSANGGLDSGAVLQALQARGQGIADQEYGTFMDRLDALSSRGLSALGEVSRLRENELDFVSGQRTGIGKATADARLGIGEARAGSERTIAGYKSDRATSLADIRLKTLDDITTARNQHTANAGDMKGNFADYLGTLRATGIRERAGYSADATDAIAASKLRGIDTVVNSRKEGTQAVAGAQMQGAAATSQNNANMWNSIANVIGSTYDPDKKWGYF